ncbi:hypothetical protein BMS3Abin04_00287 [bacterium BMS3Abin04]|nr:hypothetical protein BMS3Abin04_00287 [bacterium BMS3Abin04]
MVKVSLGCVLENKYMNKIKAFNKNHDCTYNHLFGLALKDFLKTYDKNKKLVLKEANFVRIETQYYNFLLPLEEREIIRTISKEQKIFQSYLAREIIIGYLKNNQ